MYITINTKHIIQPLYVINWIIWFSGWRHSFLTAIITADCQHLHIKIGTCESIWKTTVAMLDLCCFIMHSLKNSHQGRRNLLVRECELYIKSSLEGKCSVPWRKIKAKLHCIDIISGTQERSRKLQPVKGDSPPVSQHMFWRRTCIQQFTLIFHWFQTVCNIFIDTGSQTIIQLSLNIPILVSQSTGDHCIKTVAVIRLSTCFCSPSTRLCFTSLCVAWACVRGPLGARWHIHARSLMNQTPSALASPVLSWGSPRTARTLLQQQGNTWAI